MGVDPDKINASLRALSDAVYKNGMRTNGLGTITTDELHAYEEGLNSRRRAALPQLGRAQGGRAADGHGAGAAGRSSSPTRPATCTSPRNWYGGRKIYREGPWEWQKPYSFTVLHAPILIGLYNGNPPARALVTGTIDGWMAHGKQDARRPLDLSRTRSTGAPTPNGSATAAA